MKSTFDEFITDDPKQKALFDKEYDDFLLSEFIIQKWKKKISQSVHLHKRLLSLLP